jgi:hypothetical protein
MEITKWLVAHYIRQVTVGWFANDPLPPPEVEDYTNLIEQMADQARQAGELEPLGLAIDYLLAHPEIDTAPLAAVVYPYHDDQVREILRYAREVIFGRNAPAAGTIENVQWVDTPLASWRSLKRA